MMMMKKYRMYTIPSSYCYNKVCIDHANNVAWGLHGGAAVDLRLLGCDAATAGEVILDIFEGSFTFKSK